MAYVCICNPTTDKQVIDKIKTSISIEQVQQELQICNNCTACSVEIRKLFCSTVELQELLF